MTAGSPKTPDRSSSSSQKPSSWDTAPTTASPTSKPKASSSKASPTPSPPTPKPLTRANSLQPHRLLSLMQRQHLTTPAQIPRQPLRQSHSPNPPPPLLLIVTPDKPLRSRHSRTHMLQLARMRSDPHPPKTLRIRGNPTNNPKQIQRRMRTPSMRVRPRRLRRLRPSRKPKPKHLPPRLQLSHILITQSHMNHSPSHIEPKIITSLRHMQRARPSKHLLHHHPLLLLRNHIQPHRQRVRLLTEILLLRRISKQPGLLIPVQPHQSIRSPLRQLKISRRPLFLAHALFHLRRIPQRLHKLQRQRRRPTIPPLRRHTTIKLRRASIH